MKLKVWHEKGWRSIFFSLDFDNFTLQKNAKMFARGRRGLRDGIKRFERVKLRKNSISIVRTKSTSISPFPVPRPSISFQQFFFFNISIVSRFFFFLRQYFLPQKEDQYAEQRWYAFFRKFHFSILKNIRRMFYHLRQYKCTMSPGAHLTSSLHTGFSFARKYLNWILQLKWNIKWCNILSLQLCLLGSTIVSQRYRYFLPVHRFIFERDQVLWNSIYSLTLTYSLLSSVFEKKKKKKTADNQFGVNSLFSSPSTQNEVAMPPIREAKYNFAKKKVTIFVSIIEHSIFIRHAVHRENYFFNKSSSPMMTFSFRPYAGT